MNSKIKFYAFRGNVEFSSLDLFNYDKKENGKYKNEIFRKFFSNLKENKLKSNYAIREYILIYVKSIGDNIIHCQLARKRNSSLFQLKDYKIEEFKNDDYPFVNVFVELNSQKFLIEAKSSVFDNIVTCKKTIENIIRKDLISTNSFIEINPITEESSFWDKINNYDVYSVEFNLNAPNWLDSSNAATELMKEIRKNTGADKAKIEVSTTDKNPLNLNHEKIKSFVEYSTAGAGSWMMKYKNNETGKIVRFKSNNDGELISIDLDDISLSDLVSDVQMKIIMDAFDKVEVLDKFKGGTK